MFGPQHAQARSVMPELGGAMVNLKLELLVSQMAKVSFNYTPSKDTKMGSIPSNLLTLLSIALLQFCN
jgi:5,10-methylenetetrahydrofolate reductase